jgi:hypothetical protein
VNIRRSGTDRVAIEVSYSFCFTMLWDAFKSELKSAHVAGRGRIRRERITNARRAAQLMIQLNGRESALPMLRSIARHVAWEVRQ